MTTDRPRPAEDGSKGMPAGLRTAVKGWRRRAAAGEQAGTLTLPGRVLHVSVRGGDPRWPPLLLCNGIGAEVHRL